MNSLEQAPITRSQRRLRWALLFCVAAAILLTTTAAAQQTRPALNLDRIEPLILARAFENNTIHLLANKSLILNTTRPYTRVSTAQSEIADVNPVGATSILLTARKAGTTQLAIWDENDRAQMIEVSVDFDLDALQKQFKGMFPSANIRVASANGAIVLRGRVPNTEVADQAAQVAAPYATKVINLLEIAGGRQVMLQVRFAEVSRSATTALGVNFGFTDGRSFGGSNIGQVNPLGIVEGPQKGTSILGLQTPSPSVTLFGRGVAGESALYYFVNALRQNNLLRILAEPNLVATSGQEASFLAGGEFPIPIAQSGSGTGGSPAITVEYREFGVRLVFVPVVLGDGRIRLKVAPEVSDLDFTTAVKFNGFVVPGLTSRKVQTTVELAEGQTFAIAGLLNSSIAANKDVTPVLGDIPVLGALFRSVRYQRKETELVVLVTPRLVEALNPDQVSGIPGEKWRHPSEIDLLFKADLGGPAVDKPGPTTRPASASAEPPRFYGPFGFQPAAVSAAAD